MPEIFFFDQGNDPRPKEEVTIEELKADPYPDGERVKLTIILTEFLEKPNLSIIVMNSAGETVASSEVLEVMSARSELTIHLRDPQSSGPYTVRTALYYGELDPLETREIRFDLGVP